MESRSGGTNTVDPNDQTALPAIVNAQPWWCAPVFAPVISSKSPLVGTEVGHQQPSNSVDSTDEGDKETQNMSTRIDGNLGEENQNLQPASTSMTPVMSEILAPHTQLELGQSMACAAYPFNDPYFTSLMAAYGTQALVHPQIIGMPHSRMPLPLEMTEEPVFVNAKQYHGILRRRQSRAKAELEKKAVKSRKPYLHESRHLHAMRRARGCGGRFLNTKKTDDDAKTETQRASNSATALSIQSTLSSSSLTSDCSGNANQEYTPESKTPTNTKDGCQEQSGSMFSSYHQNPGERTEDEDCSGQQRAGIMVNRPPSRAVAI